MPRARNLLRVECIT